MDSHANSILVVWPATNAYAQAYQTSASHLLCATVALRRLQRRTSVLKVKPRSYKFVGTELNGLDNRESG